MKIFLLLLIMTCRLHADLAYLYENGPLFDTQVAGIHIPSRQITQIFPAIGHFKNLRILWLYNNQLQTVPHEIGELLSLETLQLEQNRLTCLPDEIGALKNLKELIVFQNNLESLPNSIGDLDNLEVLHVAENPLQFFPTSMKKLKRLRRVLVGSLKAVGNENAITLARALAPILRPLIHLQGLEVVINGHEMPPEKWTALRRVLGTKR